MSDQDKVSDRMIGKYLTGSVSGQADPLSERIAEARNVFPSGLSEAQRRNIRLMLEHQEMLGYYRGYPKGIAEMREVYEPQVAKLQAKLLLANESPVETLLGQ